MKQLSLFRILTFVLLPVAAIFGFMALLFLLAALSNPAALLFAFLFSCFVIYVFASLTFVSKGIDTAHPCKASLRDWIRVNAYVSVFLGVMFLLNSLSVFLIGPVALREFVAQMLESQPNVPATFTPDFFIRIMKIVSGFMLVVSLILLVHIFLNFRMMKIYRDIFQDPGHK